MLCTHSSEEEARDALCSRNIIWSHYPKIQQSRRRCRSVDLRISASYPSNQKIELELEDFEMTLHNIDKQEYEERKSNGVGAELLEVKHIYITFVEPKSMSIRLVLYVA